MYKPVHGIADKLKGKELKVRDIGIKKLKLTEKEALDYAEETVDYAAQTLAKFRSEYYKNETYFTKKGKLTKESQEKFESQMRKEGEYGYFKRGNEYYTLYPSADRLRS